LPPCPWGKALRGNGKSSPLNRRFKFLPAFLIGFGLVYSFWLSPGWLQLCAGLALFLFGMQCLEEGLKELAGGRLEALLGRSTATPLKGFLFGVTGTFLLQSSTLVSLLTVAFVSSGLISLTGGLTVVFGSNLGSTSGIWLLALAGHDFDLASLASPLLVFGVLVGFNGPKSRATGRILLAVGFLFLGIEQIKDGFSSFGSALDVTRHSLDGLAGQLLFVLLGMLLTVVLQSSHATLMLALTALAGAQLELGQGLAIAIGAHLGSSVTTAFAGLLGSNRAGQQLALAHALFNGFTALATLALLSPLTWLMHWLAALLGLADNRLLQLALFHSLFNAFGVLLFWPWQRQLVGLLERWLPARREPQVLIAAQEPGAAEVPRTRARYLGDSLLESADAAASAVLQELQHLGRLSLEVICHALYLPVEQLARERPDEALLRARPDLHFLDAEALYQWHVKGVYGDLLSFMGRVDMSRDEDRQQFWIACQLAALQLVDAVKDAKHLQKNLGHYLRGEDSPVREAYVDLRRHLLAMLREVRELGRLEVPDEAWHERLQLLDERAADFDAQFRARLFAAARRRELDGLQTGSLMNDLGYVSRIVQSLRNVLQLGDGQSRALRRLTVEDEPLIQLK